MHANRESQVISHDPLNGAVLSAENDDASVFGGRAHGWISVTS
jgi:hypothetical protein